MVVVELQRELMKCKLGATQDPDTFFLTGETIQRRLKALKQNVTDEMLAAMILSKLQSS